MKFLEIDNSFRWPNCPHCHSQQIKRIGPIDYFKVFTSYEVKLKNQPEYWRCQNCQSGFIQNLIPEKTAQELYTKAEENRWATVEFTKGKTRQLVKKIEPYFKRGLEVLDIGCNSGELLDFAKQFGCLTYGIEYSEKQIEICRNKGHQIYSDIDDIKEKNKFDLIFAFDLVEHLYKPDQFLVKAQQLLKPNGRLVILTGNPNSLSAKLARNNWWYLTFPEHTIFPSLEYFQQLNNYNLETYLPVFNSTEYQKSFLLSLARENFGNIKNSIKNLLTFKYNGIPSLDKDHALIILKKYEA